MRHFTHRLLHLLGQLGHNQVPLRRIRRGGHGHSPLLFLRPGRYRVRSVMSQSAHFRQLIANGEHFHERPLIILVLGLVGPLSLLHIILIDQFHLIGTRLRLRFTIEEPADLAINVGVIYILHLIHIIEVLKGIPYNVFLQQLATEKSLVLIQECHVWTFNVNTILDDSLLGVIIGLGTKSHEEAERALVGQIHISGQLLDIGFQEVADLLMTKTMAQRRITVVVKVQIHE